MICTVCFKTALSLLLFSPSTSFRRLVLEIWQRRVSSLSVKLEVTCFFSSRVIQTLNPMSIWVVNGIKAY